MHGEEARVERSVEGGDEEGDLGGGEEEGGAVEEFRRGESGEEPRVGVRETDAVCGVVSGGV